MIETKISSDGANEVFIKASDPQALQYKSMVLAVWPNTNLQGLQMISFDATKNKVNLTFDVYPSDEIKNEFAVADYHQFCDYYAVECYLDLQWRVLKIYDQNLPMHPLPSLPAGSRIDILKSGVGVYYGRNVEDYRKVYFLHNDVDYVKEFFSDLSLPIIKKQYKYAIFGLEYNVKTMNIHHISYYDIQDKDNIYSKDSLKQ